MKEDDYVFGTGVNRRFSTYGNREEMDSGLWAVLEEMILLGHLTMENSRLGQRVYVAQQ